MTTFPQKELFRPDEVAKYYDVSVRTVYFWIRTGQLEAVKVGRLLRIPLQKIKKFQRRNES